MKPTLNEKFLAYLVLFSGIVLSVIAEYYSILGLTAIFAAAVIPVIIMGVGLGVGKIAATLWLKQNWKIAPWSIRIYLSIAIIVLMMVTSMGIFGLLSKAHSDQTLISGGALAKITIYDEKIKIARENIEANRKQLKQMDEAVDQVMVRSQDEKGADKAVSIRRTQSRDRNALAKDIEANQKQITSLNDEAAPLRAEVRKVEAEVGPIKYIAAFVYGNTDTAILERAVTWVIILLIVVFDPLAVVLLLSSQISFQNFRERKLDSESSDWTWSDNDIETLAQDTMATTAVEKEDVSTIAQELTERVPAYEADDGPLTDKQLDAIRQSAPQPASSTDKFDFTQHPYLLVVPERRHPPGIEAVGPLVYSPETLGVDNVIKDEPALFVQNEEQGISNLWTSTATNISSKEYAAASLAHRNKQVETLIQHVKEGRVQMSDVPENLLTQVKARV